MKTALFIILCFFTGAVFSQLRSTNDLLGKWAGNQLRVEFIDHSSLSVVFPGGKKETGTYYADFFRNPVLLELSFNDGNGKVELKCLVQLLQPNTIKWQAFDKATDPKEFSNNFYTLSKVRN